MKKNNILLWVGLVTLVLFVFRGLLTPGPHAWGDAPYFYPEHLKEFAGKPYAWTTWGETLGGVNKVLWLSPILFLSGMLNVWFGTDSGALLLLLFYIPAISLSVFTSALLAKRLGYGLITQLTTSLLYTLNTYFLLVIDGGQVGIALSYGIFPLAVLYIRDLISGKGFARALLVFFVLLSADLRIAIIAVLAGGTWYLIEVLFAGKKIIFKRIPILIFFFISLLGLGWFALYPSLKLISANAGGTGQPLEFNSLLNAFFLYQPHWPENIFGKITYPPFYFLGVPLLVFGGIFLQTKKDLCVSLTLLLFAFLSKGTAAPLGDLYGYLLQLPLGIAFRDSSKFFIPVVLLSGILVGTTLETVGEKLKERNLNKYKGVLWLVPVYLLLLIFPAVKGDLPGVLKGRTMNLEVSQVNETIRKQEVGFRTAWFPERHPWSYHTEEKSTVDAKRLVDARPFAAMNVGTGDHFNFLHNDQAAQWLGTFGIRYLVFSGDTRRGKLNAGEEEDWNTLLNLASGIEGLKRQDTKVPMYEVADVKPPLFSVEKAAIVVGSDDVYAKLKKQEVDFTSLAFLFVEDGKFNPKELEKIESKAAFLLFDNRGEVDLQLSLLQAFFGGTRGQSQWATRDSEDYLAWKYELLNNEIKMSEFDYGKGIAFSSVKNEVHTLSLEVKNEGKHILAIRGMAKAGNIPLKVRFNGQDSEILFKPGQMHWYLADAPDLKPGRYELRMENGGDFYVVNTAALFPEEDWREAEKTKNKIMNKFETINTDKNIQDIKTEKWNKIKYKQNSPVEYSIFAHKGAWVIFSDTYNPSWRAGTDTRPYPTYSAANAFYLPDQPPGGVKLFFDGQKAVDDGLKVSVGSALALIGLFLVQKVKDKWF